MAAPTPRPAKLKLLNGTAPGRDSGGRLVKPTPNFDRACPDPPTDLGVDGLDEWRRVGPSLERLNLLKPEDYAALVQHCHTWQTYITAIRQVRAEGLTLVNPATGCPRKNPAVSVAEVAGGQLLASCREFGLTPSAEQRLVAAPDTDDGSDLYS